MFIVFNKFPDNKQLALPMTTFPCALTILRQYINIFLIKKNFFYIKSPA